MTEIADDAQDTAKPLLKPWYKVRTSDEGVVVRYGDHALVFRGRTAQSALPRILPLLDGTRSQAEVEQEMGDLAELVQPVIQLLADNALLCPEEREHIAAAQN